VTENLPVPRILSLDGGVRGLFSLLILKEIIGEINAAEDILPCQYFDIIGETSTGRGGG